MIMRHILPRSDWWKFSIWNVFVDEPTNQKVVFLWGFHGICAVFVGFYGIYGISADFFWDFVGIFMGFFAGFFVGFSWDLCSFSRVFMDFCSFFCGVLWNFLWIFYRMYCGIFMGFLQLFVGFCKLKPPKQPAKATKLAYDTKMKK